ncbi:MAG: AAA family ATPase [Acidimicrobiales bacterium]
MPKAQLVELYAHKLGVIDDAHLEFGAGFNVLTGETGAGKTLLVGALGLCLGSDASATRYAVSGDTRATALFVQHEGAEVALAREASESGRLRSLVNGSVSSAEALRTIAEDLIIIHGQHDSLLLKSRNEIVRLIDESGSVDISELSDVRRKLRDALQIRDSYGGDAATRDRERDYLEFQVTELESARIVSASELDDALSELSRLTALRDGQASIIDVVDLFDGDRDDAVLPTFARGLSRLPDGDAYDSIRRALDEVLVQARDSVHELAALGDPDSFDPRIIEDLEERVGLLQRLAKKYGGTLAEALHALDDLRALAHDLDAAAERIVLIDQEIHALGESEHAAAALVREARERAAAGLTVRVQTQLTRVALANAVLRFVVSGEDGSDAQVMFSANPGQGEGPLSALASGGELSRILLALSLETAHRDVVAVFDEIDAGLGGQVAQQIGECLYEVGRAQQVLAITHLASVAARADHHFVIEKLVMAGTTTTSVREVSGDERVREVARMLAGDTVTEESRALATQLLENSIEGRTASQSSR